MGLCKYNNFWLAGICLYGISDLIELEKTTHRFEKPYNQTLLGKLPKAKPIWKKRSPINLIDKINAPLLIFHGTEDKAVNFKQSQTLVNKLEKNNKTYEFYPIEGEGHGFKKPESKKIVFDKIKKFLNKVTQNK